MTDEEIASRRLQILIDSGRAELATAFRIKSSIANGNYKDDVSEQIRRLQINLETAQERKLELDATNDISFASLP